MMRSDAPDPVAPGSTPDPATDPPAPPPASATSPTPTVASGASRRAVVLSMAIAIVAVLAGSGLFLSGYTLGQRTASEPSTPISDADAFRPFWDTYHTITDTYAGGDVDRETLIQGAIKGMVGALGDPYSSYLTAQEYRSSLQGISGQFEGVGAEIGTQGSDGTQGCAPLGASCHLLVVSAFDGSPAEQAGIQAGDLILATDGTTLDGLTVDAARARVRGPKGTMVTLRVQRGVAAPFDVAITRDVVQRREVTSKVLGDGSVGYVRLNDFSDAAAATVRDDLAAHVAAGRTSLILDLRGDPGGFVTAARSVASEFIGAGTDLLGAGRERRPARDPGPAGRRRDGPEAADRLPHRRRERLGERDRGGCPPGLEAGHAGRPDLVRQGHRAALDRAHRRGRRGQAHDRPVADAGQALDPRGRADAGRRRRRARGHARGKRPDARQGAPGPRGDGRRSGRSRGRLSRQGGRGNARRDAATPALASPRPIGYGFRERKEVMCSDRQ